MKKQASKKKKKKVYLLRFNVYQELLFNTFFIKFSPCNSGKYLTSYSKMSDDLKPVNSRSVIPDTLK